MLRHFVGVKRSHHEVATNLFLLWRWHGSVLAVGGRSVGFPFFSVRTGHNLAKILNVATKDSYVLVANIRDSSTIANLGFLLSENGIDSSSDGSSVLIGTLLVTSLERNVGLC